jgi:hypothetical protein
VVLIEPRPSAARLSLDEDVDVAIQAALQRLGYDTVTARDRRARRARDDAHLLAAARDKRVFVTHNASDFKLLQEAWRTWGMSVSHAGILVLPQQRWNAEEAAAKIDEFVRSGVDPTNELYQWTPQRGWTKYEW